MTTADILQVAGTGATAVAAIAAWRATHFAQRSASDARIDQRKRATIEHIRQVQAEQASLRKELGRLDEEFDLEDGRRPNASQLATIWEHTAAGVNHGVFDVEVFNKLSGGAFLAVYRDCVRFIRLIRHQDTGFFDQIEALVDQVLVMRRLSGYRISRVTVDRCRRFGLDRNATRALRKHAGSGLKTYHELELLLIAEGIETEKSVISALTREQLYEVTVVPNPPAAEVLDLLSRSYDVDQTTVSGWLQSRPPTQRVVARKDRQVVACADVAPLDVKVQSGIGWSEAVANAPQGAIPDVSRLGQIIRLAVHPDHQGRDLGRLVLRQAIRTIEVSLQRVAVIGVVDDSGGALQLALSEGGRRFGRVNTEQGDSRAGVVF